MAEIKFTFTGDTSNLDKALDNTMAEIRTMGKAVGASVNDINNAFAKMGKELVKNAGADKALATLNKKMKQQADKVGELKKEYDALDVKMTEFSKNGGKAKDFADIQQYEKVSAELKKAQSEYDQLSAAMAGAERQASMFTKTVNGVTYEGSSARGVLMQMQAALDKMGEEGKSATAEYENLRDAMANLKDATSDAKQSVSGLASDTAKLDAIMGGLNVAAGGFSAAVGSMEMFGAESEDVAEAQKKLQSAIAITTGLTSLQNNLQKQSNLMLGIHNIQTSLAAKGEKMLAAAKSRGTAATIAATAAQKAFNLVAKANPYLLLFLALMTVVGGIALFSQGLKRAEKDQKRAAESAQRWAQKDQEIYEIEKRLAKVRQDAAKQAVDLASAEGKSAREVLALKEQQLKVDQEINTKAKKNHSVEIKNLDNNRKALERYERELETAKASKGTKYEFIDENGKKQKGKIDDTYIETIQARVDAYRAYVEIAEEVIATERDLEVSAARLVEERRQLTIEEEKANTTARRTTQDLRDSLETDENAKQRKQIQTNYNRQIEDLKTRLATEKNLTDEQQKEINAQIILLRKNRDKELQQFDRQRLNDQIQIQRDAEAKLRDLSAERLEQETSQTLETIRKKAELEKQARLDELQAQKESWIKEQGGQMDAQGRYTDTSKLTDEQNQYLERAEKNIIAIYGDGVKALGSMVENEIFERYSTALQRAIKDQEKFESEIDFLQGAGKDTSEAERQRNEQALAYMQNVEGGLTPEFQRWIDSLAEYTTNALEEMLSNAEAEAMALRAKGASEADIIAAQARVAALRKELKEAQTDIQRGPKLTAYKNLNKVLGDAASGFEALGQTGNEAFDKMMKDISEFLGSVQSIVSNIQTLVESSIRGMETTAQEGANAVKTVEKASVILAIIGAALQLAMKIKNMIADESKSAALKESIEQCEKLKAAFSDLRREMLLDVSGNNTIFGDNMYVNLRQFTDGVNTLTNDLEGNRQAVRGLADNYYSFIREKDGLFQISITEDKLIADVGKYHDVATGINEVADALANYRVNVDSRKKFARWAEKLFLGKGDTITTLAADYKSKTGEALDLIGETEEETFKNLQTLRESDYFEKNADKDLKASMDEMLKNYESYFEAKGEIQSVYQNWFGGMSNAFAESIKMGFTDGAKAGRENFKEQVNGMISDMYLQLTVGQAMEDILKQASAEITDLQLAGASPAELAAKAAETADLMMNKYDMALEGYTALQDQLEARGYGLQDVMDGTLSGAIKGASQESIDLLSGYCNAVRIQQVDSINIMRDQLISLSGIEGNTRSIDNHFASFRREFANSLTQDASRASGVILN